MQNIEDSPAATESWQEIVENFLWQTMSQPLPKYGIVYFAFAFIPFLLALFLHFAF